MFVKLGKLIAGLLLIYGALRLVMGIWVATAFESRESMLAASRRYLATENSGDAIDQGMILIVAGVILGLLAKIAGR